MFDDTNSSQIGLDDGTDLEDIALNQTDHLPKDNKSYRYLNWRVDASLN